MKRIKYIVSLVVVYSICSIWGECGVKFQSPTNDANTNGISRKGAKDAK